MALLPNFPISGDDYTVGTITTVAGSKDFTTKDAYLQSYGAVQAGDHIYIASAGKFLIIASITGENSGTLTDPCPDDCAVTDADLRIIFKTASSRLQGRTAMLLERLAKGCLASLAELSPREGQIFRATNVEGQLEAVDNTADNVIETDGRKFMTEKDRQSIDNVVKRVDGLTTDNVPETDTHKYFPPDFNADSLAETPNHKVMTADEREKIANLDDHYLSKSGGTVNGDLTVKNSAETTFVQFPPGTIYPMLRLGYTKEDENYSDLAFVGESLNINMPKVGDVAKFYTNGTAYFSNEINIQGKTYWQLDGNITGTCWDGGNLWQHIENRYHSCVTNSQMVGWADIPIETGRPTEMTSGYVVTAVIREDSGRTRICGRQPQLKIANRGWFPLGAW